MPGRSRPRRWADVITGPDPEGEPYVDQNFDSYSVEYTFADGARMYHGWALHQRLQ